MALLFVLSSALILYGTLYPFNFSAAAYSGDTLSLLAASFCMRPGRGDILSNVVLFLPFGFFGMQGLFRAAPRLLRGLLVVALGVALSFAIEYIQTYLPHRVTSVYDIALNGMGALIGVSAGWVDWRGRLAKLQGSSRPPVLFPLILLCAWLGYRLFPYVPTIDFQHVKNALKPILSTGLPPVDVLRHVIVTLVVGRLLQALTLPRHALLLAVLLPLGVIAAKPFIMTKVILPAEAVGVVVGVAVWALFLHRARWRTGLVAVLLALQIAVQGLLPLNVRPDPVLLSFVPFIGFEGGSMSVNLQSFFEKIFLYGALVWLLVEAGRRWVLGALAVALFLFAIEAAQMFLASRVPEITDPLLALILGWALHALDLRPEAKRR